MAIWGDWAKTNELLSYKTAAIANGEVNNAICLHGFPAMHCCSVSMAIWLEEGDWTA